MRSGKLRNSVTIQTYTTTMNSIGETVKAWTTVETVWASIEMLSAKEIMSGNQVQTDADYKITMRYTDNLTFESRIGHGNKTYEVISINNPEEKNFELIVNVKLNRKVTNG